MKKLMGQLSSRTKQLATSNRKLSAEVIHRKAAVISLRASEQKLRTLLSQAQMMEKELRHLSRRLLAAQEEERRRISRELHDVIAQTLTGINYRLSTLKLHRSEDAAEFRRTVAETQRLVIKSVHIVNRFARNLRPTALDHLGLIPALHSHLKDFMLRTGIRASLTAYKGIEKLGNEEKAMLYRVAQETLGNTARHARASQVSVFLRKERSGVSMEINDNGMGFEPSKPSRQLRRKRLGLLGMQERVEIFGGKFSVRSAPNEGTTVRVSLIPSKARETRKLERSKP